MIGLGLAMPRVAVLQARHGLSAENAMSPLKARLSSGQDASLFVNADSTGYSANGPFYKLAVALGDRHDATVVLYRWAEWEESAPTGPKAYAAPVVLRDGDGPTLTVWLAALPGGMAGSMLADQRAAAFGIPAPDLCILHQGHNMQSFEMPGGILSPGRAAFLGPLGMSELRWPGVPQLVTTQNPWRDGTGYDKIYNAILGVVAAHPGLTLVDTHAAFLAAGKAPGLYSDDIHPSASAENSAGAQLTADILLAAYDDAAQKAGFETPSWPGLQADNLLANGDFLDWTGVVPTGWSVAAPGTAVKDADVRRDAAFPYSLALRPNGSASSFLTRYIRNEEARGMIGKRISFAVLYRNSAGQSAPVVNLIVPSEGATRTISCAALQFGGAGAQTGDGWMWAVANDIPVDPTVNPAGYSFYIRINAGFGTSSPVSNAPLHVQRVVIVEGPLPRGGLGT